MNEVDYNRCISLATSLRIFKSLTFLSVVDSLRLADGTLFSIPITLDVSKDDIDRFSIVPGSRLSLRDPRDDNALAIITGNIPCSKKVSFSVLLSPVEDVYRPDHVKEAVKVFGADDPAHPSVSYLHNKVQDYYIGGKVQAIQAPTHFDYVALRCRSI